MVFTEREVYNKNNKIVNGSFLSALNMYGEKQFICINLLKCHTDFMKLVLYIVDIADILTEAQKVIAYSRW